MVGMSRRVGILEKPRQQQVCGVWDLQDEGVGKRASGEHTGGRRPVRPVLLAEVGWCKIIRNPDRVAAQVLDARQGEAPATGPRLPSGMLQFTEWLVRTRVLAEETGLLHGPGLVPHSWPNPPSQLLPLEAGADTRISFCVPAKVQSLQAK